MAACCATIAVIAGLFDTSYTITSAIATAVTIVLYGLGLTYGVKKRKGFLLAIIPFSVITIISAFFIKLSNEAGMFLFVSVFIIISITVLIKLLITIHKTWANE